jgi:hypothetical protein
VQLLHLKIFVELRLDKGRNAPGLQDIQLVDGHDHLGATDGRIGN